MVARTAGSFLGGILNNPGAIILGGIAIALLFFSSDIRKAFGSIGENFGKIELPAITLPEINFPEISFPEIKFPDITNIFGGAPDVGTEVDKLLAEGGTPKEVEALLTEEERLLDPNRDPTKFLPPDILPKQPIEELFPDQPVSISDFINRFIEPQAEPTSQLNIGQEQPFTLAPLGAQTLSTIIDKFMVTASQAANIKFISQQGGDPFADPSNIFGENPPAVSDPQFQGLTPEEIALRLTGGNISNF